MLKKVAGWFRSPRRKGEYTWLDLTFAAMALRLDDSSERFRVLDDGPELVSEDFTDYLLEGNNPRRHRRQGLA